MKKSLPDCIICDIDGTLALRGDRSPFDWSRVDRDTLNTVIYRILLLFSRECEIVLVSGRDSVCREKTEKWLKDNLVLYTGLFMRREEDKRKDTIVKREIYDKYIKGKYNVLFVLDDRNQVVDMWRNELKLTCLQVAEGNF